MRHALVNALIIGAGGLLGALARYGLSSFVHGRLPGAAFPYGTLIVNMVGCFAIGLVMGLVESRQLFGPEFRAFALIGVLGAFTTYSTFGFETFALLRDGAFVRAALNVGVQVLLGLGLVWLGYAVSTTR